MSERPGVSIVIDSYNHAPYVAAAIESALNQDYPHTEVIVVDDGSPDNSHEIIAGFGDAIKTLFQANQGQVAACTAGFDLTQYDIVIFLDSDDLLVPHAVSAIVPHWTPKVAKIQFCLSVIDGDGRALGNVFPKYPEELTPDRVHAEWLRTGSYPDAPTSGNAYTRRFLKEVLPLSEATRNGIDGSSIALHLSMARSSRYPRRLPATECMTPTTMLCTSSPRRSSTATSCMASGGSIA